MRRELRSVLAALLAAVVMGSVAPAAWASDEIGLAWDGSTTYTTTLDGSVFGDITVVPGDSGSRQVQVRNDGPSEGTLTVQVTNITAIGADDGFFDELRLGGVGVKTLLAGPSRIAAYTVPAGAVVPVVLTYELPLGARGGNTHVSGPHEVSFDVLLTLSERAADPQPDPTNGPSRPATPSPTPAPTDRPGPTQTPSSTPRLDDGPRTSTGASALRSSKLVPGALVVLGLVAAAVAVLRRRKRD